MMHIAARAAIWIPLIFLLALAGQALGSAISAVVAATIFGF